MSTQLRTHSFIISQRSHNRHVQRGSKTREPRFQSKSFFHVRASSSRLPWQAMTLEGALTRKAFQQAFYGVGEDRAQHHILVRHDDQAFRQVPPSMQMNPVYHSRSTVQSQGHRRRRHRRRCYSFDFLSNCSSDPRAFPAQSDLSVGDQKLCISKGLLMGAIDVLWLSLAKRPLACPRRILHKDTILQPRKFRTNRSLPGERKGQPSEHLQAYHRDHKQTFH